MRNKRGETRNIEPSSAPPGAEAAARPPYPVLLKPEDDADRLYFVPPASP